MKHAKRRIRCRNCGSLKTKRHVKIATKKQGQSKQHIHWYCKDCHKTFFPWQNQLNQKMVKLYFENGASYRAVGHDLGLNPLTAYRRVIHQGFNCKSPWEVSLELRPHWCGYLGIDGDSVLVGRKKQCLMIGADAYSQDIPHAILAEHEDGPNWTHFLLVIKDPIHYPLKGIVSDGDPAIQEARKAVFPEVPYQLCVKHFKDDLERFLCYRFTQRRGYWREIERFLKAVDCMLYAPAFALAQKYLEAILFDPGFKKAGLTEAIVHLREKFPLLTTHHSHPGMPRTNNITEGIISRLDSKINQADGYNYSDTAWATLKMLIMRYRFKKFTDCKKKNKHKNGKSPLELAGVNTSNINWVRFSQKP